MRDLITSITKNPDDYDERYMKIISNSDEELPLNKMIKIPSMNIIRKIFRWMFAYIIDANETKSFYILLAFILIIIALLIVVIIYCYLIKYKAKQKYLLPF